MHFCFRIGDAAYYRELDALLRSTSHRAVWESGLAWHQRMFVDAEFLPLIMAERFGAVLPLHKEEAYVVPVSQENRPFCANFVVTGILLRSAYRPHQEVYTILHAIARCLSDYNSETEQVSSVGVVDEFIYLDSIRPKELLNIAVAALADIAP